MAKLTPGFEDSIYTVSLKPVTGHGFRRVSFTKECVTKNVENVLKMMSIAVPTKLNVSFNVEERIVLLSARDGEIQFLSIKTK